MKRLFTSILLAALFILSGCKKEQQIEEPPRTDIDPENAKYDQESLEYTYDWGEHSVPVEQGTADQIKIVNAKCFSLPYTNISDKAYNKDDVVVIPNCESFPGGMTARITQVSNVGGTRQYKYEQVALDEVFQNLHFSQTGLDLSPYADRIITPDGKEIPLTKVQGGLELSIPEVFGGLNSLGIDFGENLSISPSMKIAFKMALDVDIVDYACTYARVRVDATAKLGCDFTIKGGKSKTWTTAFFEIPFAPIPVGPLVLTPSVFVAFVFKINGEVNMTISFNYEKSYYAMALYDGQELHTKAGEVGTSSSENPFSVSLNLSGSVEAGPNVGVTLSIYKGALGVGIDFDPHFEIASTISVPLSPEYLMNFGSSGYQLSNMYYEPALSFKFGGYVELLYKWRKEIKVPDNVALKYSFGKTYIFPQNCKKVEVSTAGGVLSMKTWLKNKALFADNLHINLRNKEDEKDVVKIPFTLEGSLKDKEPGDSVLCSLNYDFTKLPGYKYKIDGPFIDMNIFGNVYELAPGPSLPSFNRDVYVVDTKVEAAVRGILEDLYASRDGEWEGCNWADPNVGLNGWKNVSVAYYSDKEIANGDSEYHYAVAIEPQSGWKFANEVRIGNHSEGMSDDSFRWSLGRVEAESLIINDVHFWYFRRGPHLSKLLEVHSPYLTEYPEVFVEPGHYDVSINLANTGVTTLMAQGTIMIETGPSSATFIPVPLTGEFNYDNCPLKTCKILGKGSSSTHGINVSGIPRKLSFKNCPGLKDATMSISDVEDISPLSDYEGSSFQKLSISTYANSANYVRTSSLNLNGSKMSFKELNLGVRFKDSTEGLDVTVSNNALLERVEASSTINRFQVSGCAKLSSINLGAPTEISVSSCPALTSLSASSSSSPWTGRLAAFSVSGTPALKNLSISSSLLNGTAPECIDICYKNGGSASYPYKYSYTNDGSGYKVYKTYNNGYIYPGEPDRPYSHGAHKYLTD